MLCIYFLIDNIKNLLFLVNLWINTQVGNLAYVCFKKESY